MVELASKGGKVRSKAKAAAGRLNLEKARARRAEMLKAAK